ARRRGNRRHAQGPQGPLGRPRRPLRLAIAATRAQAHDSSPRRALMLKTIPKAAIIPPTRKTEPPFMRCIALVIALAATGMLGTLDRACAAAPRRLPEAEFARPFAVPSCCGWPWFCQTNDCSSLYPERARTIARYEDAWCRAYGPPGSPVYLQCRDNLAFER